MPDAKIEWQTPVYRPDHTITVRAAPAWDVDVGGEYKQGKWVFSLPRDDANPFEFKFVLDFQHWQLGANLAVDGSLTAAFFPGQVTFPEGQNDVRDSFIYGLPDAENGVISRTFFAPDLEGQNYDVIVVGSGIGGGTLAEALSDRGLRTLVLEAGSYLFPTHIANLPHTHLVGQFDKHVWGLWNNNQFRKEPYFNVGAGSEYEGGMGYNLGGRSVFWGGFTPRMRPYEFEAGAWPASVRDQLLGAGEDDANSWYAKAEALMKVGEPRPSQYQTRCKSWLSNLLGGNFDVFDAPMAVQRQTGERRTLSAGMFSTADLLFESRATNGQVGNQDLVINLHHSVRRLEFNGGQVTQVVAYDRLARQERKYAANKIVLAAGTLETARIARQSGLAGRDVSNKIGVGIVDHPIWFVHFGLPAGHELFAADASAKIVIQHKAPTVTEHGWNAILELGSDWNQGRYVDDDILQAHVEARGQNTMLCELVFLTCAPLQDNNYVAQGEGEDGRPMQVHVERSTRSNVMLQEMTELKEQILGALQAYELPNEPTGLPLQLAPIGGVAHEVGTCRMSDSPEQGVVNADLAFHGMSNLYACDLSVFPSSPAANPTLALGALALRLADKLVDEA